MIPIIKTIELAIENLLQPTLKSAAYLDPGSGSFIIQLLIASFVGIMFALRGYWSKFLSIFKKSNSDQDGADHSQQDDE